MRSFQGSRNFVPSATQPQIYTPARQQNRNQIFAATDNSKNKNRAQQIVSLHQQFEDLKKKIKQVQNKNQKIIQKIHRQCNFKKKNPQIYDVSIDNTAPIVYYQKKQRSQVSQVSGMSIDQSNKSDQSQYQFKQKKNVVQRNSVQSNKNISPTIFSQSMQYTKQSRERDYNKQKIPPRMDKIHKKYSKVSAQNNNRFQENANSINSQQILMQGDFQEQTPNLKFQIQGSHQTYSRLKDYGQGSGINNGSGVYNNNSGKKSIVIASYPSSQTQMAFSGGSHYTGHKLPLSPSQQPLFQQPSMFNPRQNTSSLHQSAFNLPMYQVEQSLKIQKQKTAYLEQQLKNKQFQILNIKKEYNKVLSQFDNLEMILQDHLDNFMENVIKKGFFDIQKVMKKNQNRIRNLGMMIKDQYEEHKSAKLIKEHQLRRFNSRSKRDLSPLHNTSINSVISPLLPPGQQAKIPRPASGNQTINNFLQIQPAQQKQRNRQPRQIKSKISEQSYKKNKQFQQIVTKYQQMINSKNLQISKLQTLIKSLNKKNDDLEDSLDVKNKQIKQITIKMQELEKLMSQTNYQVPIIKSKNSNQTNNDKRKRVSSSAQSNLLEDICQQQTIKQYKQTQYQLKYLQIKQQLQQKLQTITELQTKILSLQLKARSAQSIKIQNKSNYSNNSSNSSHLNQQKLIKQKIQQAKKQLTQQHQTELEQKQYEIKKFKHKISQMEKLIVEKDCQIISFQNKLKKAEGINQINSKKIDEYEKLLNHYQHNNSVDLQNHQVGMMLLDRSLCHENNGDNLTSRSTTGVRQSQINQKHKLSERSAKKSIVISRIELQNLQNKIQSMNQQILSLTKKLKNSQNVQKQNFYELQRLNDQLEMMLIDKQKLAKENTMIKDKIVEMEEKLEQFGNNSSVIEGDNNEEDYQNQIQYQNNNNSKDIQSNQQPLNQNNSIYSQKSQTTSRIKNKKSVNRRKKSQMNNQVYLLTNNIQFQKREIQRRTTEQQQSKKRLQQQIQSLKQKNSQIIKQLNYLKTEHLEISRSNIGLKKDNQYLLDSLSDREQKYEKYRKEAEGLKVKLNEMMEVYQKKDQELKKEKQENCLKIQELEKQWYQFEQQINRNNNNSNSQGQNALKSSFIDQFGNKNSDQHEMLKSSRYNFSESSMLLSSTLHNKNSQYLQQQNQYLTIKLKQAQATIQMHNMMEQKVLNQYKINVQKLKQEVKQKARQSDLLKKEHEILKDNKRRLEILYESSKNEIEQAKAHKQKMEKEIVNRKKQLSEYTSKKSQKSRSTAKKLIKKLQQYQQHDVQQFQKSQQKDFNMQQFASFTQQQNNLSMYSQEHIQIGTQIKQKQKQEQQSRLNPYEKILELQYQLKQSKDINKKLQQMQEELFKQIRLKQQQKNDLMKLLDEKNVKIQQLEEIVELKQMNINGSIMGSNILGSHISSSNHKSSSQNMNSHHQNHQNNNRSNNQNNLSQRESMHSHSSLQYSGITQNRHPMVLLNPSSNNLNIMNQSQMGHSQVGNITHLQRLQIQLSETGSQMLNESYVTNISQIFQKQQFPYQKVQLKRKQQIKLFEKTASYIRSLKDSINQKNKKIKLLEKKVQSLKSSHHGVIGKELQRQYEISTGIGSNNERVSAGDIDVDIDIQGVYKDYQSVQLQRNKASHNKRYKTLQHEWKLAIEENNVLANQIQALQQQLQKAEQQENNLLKIKDLYKDQIKKLITKNESQVQYYQDLLAKQKNKVEQSESVHNTQTIKQLYLKTVDSIIVMESEKSKKKREEKKKQIQEYFNIFASLVHIDEKKKYVIVEGIRKMTLNIVLAQQGRSSSSNKK